MYYEPNEWDDADDDLARALRESIPRAAFTFNGILDEVAYNAIDNDISPAECKEWVPKELKNRVEIKRAQVLQQDRERRMHLALQDSYRNMQRSQGGKQRTDNGLRTAATRPLPAPRIFSQENTTRLNTMNNRAGPRPARPIPSRYDNTMPPPSFWRDTTYRNPASSGHPRVPCPENTSYVPATNDASALRAERQIQQRPDAPRVPTPAGPSSQSPNLSTTAVRPFTSHHPGSMSYGSVSASTLRVDSPHMSTTSHPSMLPTTQQAAQYPASYTPRVQLRSHTSTSQVILPHAEAVIRPDTSHHPVSLPPRFQQGTYSLNPTKTVPHTEAVNRLDPSYSHHPGSVSYPPPPSPNQHVPVPTPSPGVGVTHMYSQPSQSQSSQSHPLPILTLTLPTAAPHSPTNSPIHRPYTPTLQSVASPTTTTNEAWTFVSGEQEQKQAHVSETQAQSSASMGGNAPGGEGEGEGDGEESGA